MFRIPRPATSLLAGLVLIVASACSSGGTATTAPGGNPGSSSGATAMATAANANDPNAIISSAISGESAVKSFHIKITLSGTVKAAFLKAEAGSAGAAITSDIKLDGTAIEGDVDLVGSAAHLALSVPALPMLGNVPLTGDVILANSVLYYKVSLLGPMYTKQDLGSLSSLTAGLPLPTAAAAATAMNVTDELNSLKAQMDAAGVTVTMVGVEQIGGQDAYHINVAFPLAKLNAEIAAQASMVPAPTIDSASLDAWIYKSNSRLAQVELKGSSAAVGNIDFLLTITNYDAPVTVAAPPASQVKP